MVFARFHLNGPETSAQAVPVHTSGSGSDGVTVSPSPAICCNCRVRPPFLDCRFASGRLHRQRRLISCVACEHSPHDPRILVGKSHGRDIGMAPLPNFAEPEASRMPLASGPA